jgi:hypothetical protein
MTLMFACGYEYSCNECRSAKSLCTSCLYSAADYTFRIFQILLYFGIRISVTIVKCLYYINLVRYCLSSFLCQTQSITRNYNYSYPFSLCTSSFHRTELPESTTYASHNLAQLVRSTIVQLFETSGAQPTNCMLSVSLYLSLWFKRDSRQSHIPRGNL